MCIYIYKYLCINMMDLCCLYICPWITQQLHFGASLPFHSVELRKEGDGDKESAGETRFDDQ